jgi:hypothetical protein
VKVKVVFEAVGLSIWDVQEMLIESKGAGMTLDDVIKELGALISKEEGKKSE